MTMISLFPTATAPQQPQGQPQSQGAGTGAAPPGAFQSMLLEALLGGPGGQGKALLGALPAQAQGKGQPQNGSRPPWAAVAVPGVAPAAGDSGNDQATPLPEGTAPAVPPALPGETPPTPAPTTAPVQAGAPTGDEAPSGDDADGESPPELPKADPQAPLRTPAGMAAAILAALAAEAAPQQPLPSVQAPAPDQSAPAQTAPAPVSPEVSDPQLEQFIAQARQLLADKESNPQGSKAAAKLHFGDLVKLVVQAQKSEGTDQPPHPVQAPPHEPKPDAGQQPAPPKLPVTSVEPELSKAADSKSDSELPQVAQAEHSKPAGPNLTPKPDDAAPPRPAVDPEQVVRQVSRIMKVMLEGKQSEVRLNLHPEHLGAVSVKLTLNEGAVKANLVTQDAAVKAALEANLDQLKSRLADQGLQVEQVHVALGSDGQFANQGHSHQHGQRHSGEARQHGNSPVWNGSGQPDQPAFTAATPAQPRAAWLPKGTGTRINSLA